MRQHEVRVRAPGEKLEPKAQLAWRVAEVAADSVVVEPEIAGIVIDRLIDNAAAAAAAFNHDPVASARAQALAHPRVGGAPIIGLPSSQTFHCEWAAWANCAAVRELDYHDNFFDLDGCDPGDNIPPVLAVAQQCGRSGRDLVRGIVTAYEIQIDLAKGIPLSSFQIDHIAHLGPAMAAGVAAVLDLPTETTFQAVQHAAHVSYSTRQARKGVISSWKAHAPGHVAKLAIEAVDRAMRGETAPSPLYEGEYSVIARMVGGPEATYTVPLPEKGEAKHGIVETYTKEHPAGYHGQAAVDLAFRMRNLIGDFEAIESVVIATRRYTHVAMGSGSNDPEKWDPDASRETLDHSLMYMFAVALQDGELHHERSYDQKRARRADTVRLWRKIRTVEDPSWNQRYETPPPLQKDHGCRVTFIFKNGDLLTDEIDVPNAHPRGATPYGREDYIRKFLKLSDGVVSKTAVDRFLNLVHRLPDLSAADVRQLHLEADQGLIRQPCYAAIF
jgi:2-methylcitrate dehydratase